MLAQGRISCNRQTIFGTHEQAFVIIQVLSLTHSRKADIYTSVRRIAGFDTSKQAVCMDRR